MSFPQGKLPPWLPPIEAQAPLRIVRSHWMALALDLFVPTLLAAMLLTGARLVGQLSAETVVVVLAVGVFTAAILSPRWYATSLTLSSRTIVVRRGLIVRSGRFIALEALQDVTTEQSLLGSLLGFGTLELRLLSGAAERFSIVPDADIVRDQIFASRVGATR